MVSLHRVKPVPLSAKISWIRRWVRDFVAPVSSKTTGIPVNLSCQSVNPDWETGALWRVLEQTSGWLEHRLRPTKLFASLKYLFKILNHNYTFQSILMKLLIATYRLARDFPSKICVLFPRKKVSTRNSSNSVSIWLPAAPPAPDAVNVVIIIPEDE